MTTVFRVPNVMCKRNFEEDAVELSTANICKSYNNSGNCTGKLKSSLDYYMKDSTYRWIFSNSIAPFGLILTAVFQREAGIFVSREPPRCFSCSKMYFDHGVSHLVGQSPRLKSKF